MLSRDSELLENAYRLLNQEYFQGSLVDVFITIQSSPRTYGHTTVNKIWKKAGDKNAGSYYELNISAEYLDRPVKNVMATLLHEMIHIYCLENNIKDTSNGYRYHNKKFKHEAEKRDLKMSYNNYIGWSITEPTERFIETLKKLGLIDLKLEHYRASGARDNDNDDDVDVDGNGENGKKKKSSTRKYQCPSCNISVRATKDVYLICGNCKETLEKVEK